jgi:hypothetical protein
MLPNLRAQGIPPHPRPPDPATPPPEPFIVPGPDGEKLVEKPHAPPAP